MLKSNKRILIVIGVIILLVFVCFKIAEKKIVEYYTSEEMLEEVYKDYLESYGLNLVSVEPPNAQKEDAVKEDEPKKEESIKQNEKQEDYGKIENINGIVDGVVYEEAYFGNMEFDSSKYDMSHDRCRGIPYSVYDTRDIQARTEAFFGTRYEEYKDILNKIKKDYPKYYKGLKYDWCWENYEEDIDSYELEPGESQYYTLEDFLDFKAVRFSRVSFEEPNDSGAEAIFFFDNYFVVYEAKLAEGDKVLLVVDYSQTAFSPDSEFITFRGILDNGFRIYNENYNYENIDGWNVIFLKHDAGRYFDRLGNEYSGQDIIDLGGTRIDW